jgi:deazaflavin-dependent oxidoreductase (nitroreductase family)
MAKANQAPVFVPWANVLTTALLRAGFKLQGFGVPMYLLTVRGRKSGQPRTTPVSVAELEGQHYVFAPYGAVNWVRNLRAAGEAVITRGRRTEAIRAQELPVAEAVGVLKRFAQLGGGVRLFLGLKADASAEEIERVARSHPVFRVQWANASSREPSAVAPSAP